MTAKNAEGYPDPTAEEAIRHVMRGGKLDYTSFRTYEELQDYTIEHNKGISTREAADMLIFCIYFIANIIWHSNFRLTAGFHAGIDNLLIRRECN